MDLISTNNFKFMKVLGKGGFGVVYLVRKKSNKSKYALKKINIEDDLKEISQEISIGQLLSHPNIPKTYLSFREENAIYVVMQYVSGSNLYKYLSHTNQYGEEFAKRVVITLLDVLQYCHKMHICHRDLKLENIIYNKKKEQFMILDWGLATQFEKNQLVSGNVGTIYYKAPETFLGSYDCSLYDIWQVGIITYECIFGILPYNHSNTDRLENIIQTHNQLSFPENVPISKEAKNFILRLTERDPKKRPSAEEALQDPWISNRSNTIDLNILKIINQTEISAIDEFLKNNPETSFNLSKMELLLDFQAQKIIENLEKFLTAQIEDDNVRDKIVINLYRQWKSINRERYDKILQQLVQRGFDETHHKEILNALYQQT